MGAESGGMPREWQMRIPAYAIGSQVTIPKLGKKPSRIAF